MKTAITTTAILLFLSTFSSTAGTLPANLQRSRDEATKDIRKTAYEMMKAFLTQDVATFKRHSASAH
jgi:hypothetical protein